GSAALTGQGFDNDGFFIETLADGQFGTQFRRFADLAALAFVMHLAAFDGVFGQRPGFEKTGRPQPFVEADVVVAVGHSASFGVRRSAFGVKRSAFGVRRSAFGVRSSEFGAKRYALSIKALCVAAATLHPLRVTFK